MQPKQMMLVLLSLSLLALCSSATANRNHDRAMHSFTGRIRALRSEAGAESERTRKLIESLDTIDDMELTQLRIPKRALKNTPAYGSSSPAYGSPSPTYGGFPSPVPSPVPSPDLLSPVELENPSPTSSFSPLLPDSTGLSPSPSNSTTNTTNTTNTTSPVTNSTSTPPSPPKASPIELAASMLSTSWAVLVLSCLTAVLASSWL